MAEKTSKNEQEAHAYFNKIITSSNTLQVEHPIQDDKTHNEFKNSVTQDKLIHKKNFVKIRIRKNLSILDDVCDAVCCESCG